jgi:CRISPR type IV-associated protein Csf3
MSMQPLKITAHLAGSIALARPEDISLDGLLSYQILRRHLGERFYNNPGGHEQLLFARLPLEMRGQPSARMQQAQTGDLWHSSHERDESFWYWSCSRAQIDVQGRDTHYWNKRFDTHPALSDHIDFGGRVEKILIEQGRYKSYHMPLSILVAEQVVWYAVGDAPEIETLLSGITAIGKKRVQGEGQVLRWHVEAIQEDWSEWRDGALMRALPGPLFHPMRTQYLPLDVQHIAFRAPQWHPANQCMCITKAVPRAL